ncbi:NrdH-redoxin [Candidatus Woesearchaeota archaeon]|nr:MAG: NrdH-redoxin [Candidatus Woesearchaeota archaeon]
MTEKTESKKPKVIVYSTPTCPYCHAAKDFLKENKIPFKDIDVSKDQSAAQEMIEKSGQMGVPVLDINGEIIVGFDKAAIKKALKL